MFDEAQTQQYYQDHAADWHQERKAQKPSFWKDDVERLFAYQDHGSLLEVGIGDAKEAKLLMDKGYTYQGVDPSLGFLQLAKQSLPKGSFHEGTVYSLPFEPETFDLFWTAATLLHVPKARIDEALQSLKSVLKPGGYGFISLKEGEGEAMDEATGRWFAYYRESEFEKILKENGFHVLESNQKLLKSKNMLWVTFIVRK